MKKLADEIVVVDGKSQDKTVELAKKEGAKIILAENKPMFHINKNKAIENCSGNWVFLIDADERVSEELAREIKKKVAQNSNENGYWVNRRNWFLGGFLTKGGAYPDPVIRLFRRGKGRLPEKSVHEQVAVSGLVGHLKNDILHLADPTFSRYLLRANRYTNQTAELIAKKDPGNSLRTIIFYMAIKPALTFLSIYFRHKGYVDGFRGFTWALFSSAHYFYAYIKYLTRLKDIKFKLN